MKTLQNTLKLVETAKTIKGTTICGIQNYLTDRGETSNYLICLGYIHENSLQKDFVSLQANKNRIIEQFSKVYPIALIDQVYTELYESLEKRLSSDKVKQALREQNDETILRSDAMKNGFEYIAKGVFLHIETDKVHLRGLEIKKTVIKPIAPENKKVTKSSDKTILKRKVEYFCNFRQSKIRSFIFDKSEVRLKGITL
jgi:hypothetical protein